ncbi:MAG: serine hydrolase [Bacteroidia bacterium]
MKFIKWIFYMLLGLIALFCSYVILSGNHYLFFTVRHTVLEGRLGPSIDEHHIYPSNPVAIGAPHPWKEKKIDAKFTQEELKFHQDYETAAFLVVHKDSIIFEYYDQEHEESSLMNPWSMAKSVNSLLIGIAIDEGLIESEDVLLSNYFDQYNGSGITIKHLLTMSSGINFDEHYLNPLSHSARSLYGKDLVELNNNYEPVRAPGDSFDYQGGNTILLGMILKKATGMSLADYASEKLWQPIEAEHTANWSMDRKDGMERAFCCLNSTLRDFARLGKLIMQGGKWKEQTVVSEVYLQKAMVPADIVLENGESNLKYGYHWWLLNIEKYKGYYARGIQGQYLVVLPEEELIVVRFGDQRPSTRYKGHVTDMLYYIDMARRMVE